MVENENLFDENVRGERHKQGGFVKILNLFIEIFLVFDWIKLRTYLLIEKTLANNCGVLRMMNCQGKAYKVWRKMVMNNIFVWFPRRYVTEFCVTILNWNKITKFSLKIHRRSAKKSLVSWWVLLRRPKGKSGNGNRLVVQTDSEK